MGEVDFFTVCEEAAEGWEDAVWVLSEDDGF